MYSFCKFQPDVLFIAKTIFNLNLWACKGKIEIRWVVRRMLGKQVEVTVDRLDNGGNTSHDGSQSSHMVLNGHIHTLAGQKSAYFMGSKGFHTSMRGTVIAIADKGINERLIVAPADCIYYEPEIRSAIAYDSGIAPRKLLCLYEKSCGAVVFRRDSDELRFLLVKNKNGCHWGFPKGHVEAGETEQQTAVREVREETGLHITILDGFRETSQYRPFGRVKKQVVFFVAQSEQSDVTIQQTEIDRFQWATFSEATRLFRYDNDVRVLQAALDWLQHY